MTGYSDTLYCLWLVNCHWYTDVCQWHIWVHLSDNLQTLYIQRNATQTHTASPGLSVGPAVADPRLLAVGNPCPYRQAFPGRPFASSGPSGISGQSEPDSIASQHTHTPIKAPSLFTNTRLILVALKSLRIKRALKSLLFGINGGLISAGGYYFVRIDTSKLRKCLVAAREERVLEREAQSVTGKSFVITSRVSPSQLSVVSLAEVVWSVSLVSSTRRPVVSWRFSLRTSSGMPLPTPSTPRGRPSQPWTSSTLWNARDVLCTDSVVKRTLFPTINFKNGSLRNHHLKQKVKTDYIVLPYFFMLYTA